MKRRTKSRFCAMGRCYYSQQAKPQLSSISPVLSSLRRENEKFTLSYFRAYTSSTKTKQNISVENKQLDKTLNPFKSQNNPKNHLSVATSVAAEMNPELSVKRSKTKKKEEIVIQANSGKLKTQSTVSCFVFGAFISFS